MYFDDTTPEKKIRTQRESGLGFLIFLKIISLYILIKSAKNRPSCLNYILK